MRLLAIESGCISVWGKLWLPGVFVLKFRQGSRWLFSVWLSELADCRVRLNHLWWCRWYCCIDEPICKTSKSACHLFIQRGRKHRAGKSRHKWIPSNPFQRWLMIKKGFFFSRINIQKIYLWAFGSLLCEGTAETFFFLISWASGVMLSHLRWNDGSVLLSAVWELLVI